MAYRIEQTGVELQGILDDAVLTKQGLEDEVARAQAAEGVLQENIDSEAGERQSADALLAGNIGTEVARAQQAESDLGARVDANAAGVAAEVARAQEAEGQVWDTLNDEILTRQSQDAALQGNIEREAGLREAGDGQLQGEIDAISGKIPAEASEMNQLADKQYVQDAIEDTPTREEVAAIEAVIPAAASEDNKLVDTETFEGAIDGKQNTLTFDEEPTEGSENPVTSGGVASAVATLRDGKADKAATLAGYGIEDAYTKDAVDEMIGALSRNEIVVGPLPQTGEEGMIYRVPGNGYYTDYMYYDGEFVELSQYSMEFDQTQVGYFTCDTAAGTAAKVVSASGYTLAIGGNIRIKMTNANTADNVTLNINGAGAKALYYNSEQASSTNSWEAGEVLTVYYDGTQYQCASSGGGKFATGENVSDVGIDDTLSLNSNNLVKNGAVADILLTMKPTGETIDIASIYQFTQYQYISLSNGVLNSGVAAWYATVDYIEIGSNWMGVVIGETGGSSSSAAVAFYDKDKIYISGSPCGTKTTVTVPENAVYVRFCKATTGSVHTIILGESVDNFQVLEGKINDLRSDVEDNYEKIAKEIDYLPQAVTGVAWKASAIGSAIVRTTNGAFESIKIPCKKGDVFGIIANSFGNSFPVVVTDDNDIVLYYVYGGSSMVGGVFEVAHNDAAWLYVSGYNTSAHNAIDKCSKLPVTHDDVIECTGEYAQAGCLAITNQYGEYGNLMGIGIPMLIKYGDVVHIKFISRLNYRGYILKSPVDGNIIGYISDIDIGYSDIDFVWNGTDAYLHIVGDTDNPPYACKYSRSVALAMKNVNRRFVSMGDSITSYDVSDVGEYIRGMIGAAWCKTSSQVDWGNIAEGNATITNTEDTTENFVHSDTTVVNNRYVNRTLPNEVLKLLQHVTPAGAQISWTIKSNNTTYSVATSVAVGSGYTDDIPDIIYISMGTNDWDTTDDFETVVAQDYGSLTKLTICSSLRWCIETLQNVFPKAVIVCVTPIMRGNRTATETEAKSALIKKICNYMAVPVVDGYHISGFNPYTYMIYSNDSVHPNTHTQRIARSIAAQVNALI